MVVETNYFRIADPEDPLFLYEIGPTPEKLPIELTEEEIRELVGVKFPVMSFDIGAPVALAKEDKNYPSSFDEADCAINVKAERAIRSLVKDDRNLAALALSKWVLSRRKDSKDTDLEFSYREGRLFDRFTEAEVRLEDAWNQTFNSPVESIESQTQS
jgi:hypothetical protein